MVERIHAGADEGRKSKGIKTAVLKFVDHFSSLIHQSSDTLVWPCSKLSRSPTLETVLRKYNNAGLRQHLKTKKTEENFDPYQNGGLDDEHASSVRPNFPRGLSRTYAFYGTPPKPEAKDLKRDHSRKNNVRTFLCLSSHEISH
jgi:hypothetical protein